MDAKSRAQDFFVTFMGRYPDGEYSQEAAKTEAKWAAGVLIGELIREHTHNHPIQWNIQRKSYWEQVKAELEKL